MEKKRKKGLGKVLLGVAKVVAPSVATRVKAIETLTQKKEESIANPAKKFRPQDYPNVLSALDIDGDNDIDLDDLTALFKLEKKELYKKLGGIALAVALAYLSYKLGVDLVL